MNSKGKNSLFIVLLVSIFLLTFLGLVSVGSTGEASSENAKGVIVEEVVPESQFNVTVSTDRTRYGIGEIMQIEVRSERSGYLTLYDIQPDGKVNVLFPNRFQGNQKIQANKTYKIPAPGDDFQFKIGPPRGRDILWAVVSSEPGVFPMEKATEDSPFPEVAKDAGEFAKNVKGVTVEQKKNWGAGYSVFYIGKPLGGHVHLSSTPKNASIYLNGSYRGVTPMTIYDLEAGSYNVTLKKEGYQGWTTTVQVSDGEMSNVSKQLVPVPVDPTIDSVGISPQPSNERQGVTFSAEATDPQGRALSYEWTIGGSRYTGQSVGITFQDEGPVNWSLRVINGSGGEATTGGTHTVKNLAPIIDSVGISPSLSAEGQKVDFSAKASDPGGDTLSYRWKIAGTNYTGKSLGLTFNDEARINWSLKVTDGDGGVARTNGTHSVQNVAPTIESTVVESQPSYEGEEVKFSAQARDPGQDSLSYDWTIAGTNHTGRAVDITFNDDTQVNWRLKVTDGDGGVAQSSGSHTVQNMNPSITSVGISPQPSVEGEKVRFSAQATDPGQDTLHFTWTIAGKQYTGSSIGLTFNYPARVNWGLKVTDGDGGVATTGGNHTVQEKEPSTTDVYITSPEEGKVMKAMFEMLGLKTVARNLNDPYGITCSSEGRLYVAENGANRIVALNETSSELEVVRELSESPLNLTFSSSGDLFFTTDQGNVWRLRSERLEKIVPGQSNVKGVEVVESGTFPADQNPYDVSFIERGKYAGDMLVSLSTAIPGQGKVVRLPAPDFNRIEPFIDSFRVKRSDGKLETKVLKTPTGLATGRKGNVYVGTYGEDERYLLRYSETGEFLEVLTHNVSRPNELEIGWHRNVYATDASFSGGEVAAGSLKRYTSSGQQMDVISHLGAWGIAICES
ncbi:DUF4384 domain-containing protein [Candidatus Bipolaricaulota bacterium]|nr:DUF4384 domain-containing protein [Candidatus Bipolaricaulota bacterium]